MTADESLLIDIVLLPVRGLVGLGRVLCPGSQRCRRPPARSRCRWKEEATGDPWVSVHLSTTTSWSCTTIA